MHCEVETGMVLQPQPPAADGEAPTPEQTPTEKQVTN